MIFAQQKLYRNDRPAGASIHCSLRSQHSAAGLSPCDKSREYINKNCSGARPKGLRSPKGDKREAIGGARRLPKVRRETRRGLWCWPPEAAGSRSRRGNRRVPRPAKQDKRRRLQGAQACEAAEGDKGAPARASARSRRRKKRRIFRLGRELR